MRLDFMKWVGVALGSVLLSGGDADLGEAGLGEAGEPATSAVELDALGGPSNLERSYGLGVVDVPAPPADLERRFESSAPACPFEVRAIIAGGDSRLAVISIDGESHVMRRGDRVRSPAGRVALARVATNHVVLRQGGVVFRCALTSKR